MITPNPIWDGLVAKPKTRATPTYKKPRTQVAGNTTVRLQAGTVAQLDAMAPLGHRSHFVRKLIEAEYAKASEEGIKA